MSLFTKTEKNYAAKERFETGLGWRYGLVLGLALIAVAWGWDAFLLAGASAELFWSKLLIAAFTVLPLSMIAATLSSSFHHAFLPKLVIWIAWSILTAFVAAHAPFEGSSVAAGLVDPSVRGVPVFPFTSEANGIMWITMILGAAAGLPAALFHVLATEWAWDRSGAGNRLTISGSVMLLVAVPFALGLGVLFDSLDNVTLRAPLLLTSEVVKIGLQTPSNTDASKMKPDLLTKFIPVVAVRDKFTPHFTQYLAEYDPDTFQQAAVDVVFDNGFMIRCTTVQYARYPGGCSDLADEYQQVMSVFLATGTSCPNCSVVISPVAARWQADQAGSFQDPVKVSSSHHAGRVVLVMAGLLNGNLATCRLLGANPIVIDSCVLN